LELDAENTWTHGAEVRDVFVFIAMQPLRRSLRQSSLLKHVRVNSIIEERRVIVPDGTPRPRSSRTASCVTIGSWQICQKEQGMREGREVQKELRKMNLERQEGIRMHAETIDTSRRHHTRRYPSSLSITAFIPSHIDFGNRSYLPTSWPCLWLLTPRRTGFFP
jgi:hypothetical protein